MIPAPVEERRDGLGDIFPETPGFSCEFTVARGVLQFSQSASLSAFTSWQLEQAHDLGSMAQLNGQGTNYGRLMFLYFMSQKYTH